jgi:hypothetical protein
MRKVKQESGIRNQENIPTSPILPKGPKGIPTEDANGAHS